MFIVSMLFFDLGRFLFKMKDTMLIVTSGRLLSLQCGRCPAGYEKVEAIGEFFFLRDSQMIIHRKVDDSGVLIQGLSTPDLRDVY